MAVYLSGPAVRDVVPHPARRRMIRRLSEIAAMIFGSGLFFFGIRALQIDPLSLGAPIWLWLCLIALVVFALYAARQIHDELPIQVAAYEREHAEQRHL
ncbi:MAG: hypothetical protein IT337_16360 [Thermomicrobiales bacterium]|nr:hypothetical protein [Thermomicrobiales bacterium]